MPASKVTDGEFIEIWRLCQGNSEQVAKKVGTNRRNVMDRRRRIEARHNLRLESTHQKADAYKALSPEEHKANHHLGLLNGQVIVFSDPHFWPGVRTTANKALLRLIRELKPKAVICGGDAFDGAGISRHPRIGWEHQPTVLEELKACKERLEEIEEAANGAKLVWTVGNHDARLSSRLASVAPQFAGVHGFQLKDHFPAWIPCWCAWINEETIVSHRWKNGVHATYQNAVQSGVNIITGHLHQLKWTPYTDFRESPRYGVDAGTLAEPKGPQFRAYLEGKHPNWGSGFVVLTFKDGRMMMPQLVRKWDDKSVEYCGQIIDVSAE